jgi:hypothetical protein
MYVQWQGILVIEMQRTDKTTWNASDIAAKCKKQIAAVYDGGLQTMLEMQWLKKAFT